MDKWENKQYINSYKKEKPLKPAIQECLYTLDCIQYYNKANSLNERHPQKQRYFIINIYVFTHIFLPVPALTLIIKLDEILNNILQFIRVGDWQKEHISFWIPQSRLFDMCKKGTSLNFNKP